MPPRNTERLPVREELFVASFLASGNATAAAKAAGYSERTAYAKGSELLKRPRVAKSIELAKSRITRKLNVNAERIVEEMAVISFSDVRNYTIGPTGYVELVPNAPDHAMRAIKKIKRKMRVIPGAGTSAVSIIEYDTELELWSKDSQLRNLGEYVKLFKENRVDGDGDDENTLTIAEREERILQLLKVALKRKKERKKAG